MVARFYFPKKNMIYHVRLYHTIMLMHRLQQANFIGFATRILAQNSNYACVNIPSRFREAAKLIGADLSEQELKERHQMSEERIKGFIYPKEAYQKVLSNPEFTIKAARENKALFFPPFGTYQLGYDCLPKTINAVLRCGFFTNRE